MTARAIRWTDEIMACCDAFCAESDPRSCWQLGPMPEDRSVVISTFNGEELRPCAECVARTATRGDDEGDGR